MNVSKLAWLLCLAAAPDPVLAQPTITAVTPPAARAGSAVTITGSNFHATASSNIVYFGAVRAAVTGTSSSSLTVTVPSGATYSPVSVTTPNGFTAYSSVPFILTFSSTHLLSSNSFGPPIDLTNVLGPQSLALGDFDGDGKSDIVAAATGTNSVSVFRNISSGGGLSFDGPANFPTAGSPQSVAVGDLNGDGKLDLAVANYDRTNIAVLPNVGGNGTVLFGPPISFHTGANPAALAIGDLDGDGIPDVVVADYGDSTISVFRNTTTIASISFAGRVPFTTGFSPFSVAIRDLDGDGKPDVVTANLDDDTVSVFRNTSSPGAISFADKVDFPTGSGPYSVAVGDIDGDGKPDLVVANSFGGSVSILRNISSSGSIGTNSFAAALDLVTGIDPLAVALGDVDGDGRPDLLIAGLGNNVLIQNLSSPGPLTTNSFGPRIDLFVSSGSKALALGDLNGDGKPELLFANESDNSVSVLLNAVPQPPIILSQPQSLQFSRGATVSFSVTADGGAPFGYQWLFNQTNALAAGTNSLLTIANAQLVNAGNYRVVVSNAFGVVTSAVAKLTTCLTPPSGLLAWWRAENDALDSAGLNHGTLLNGATFAPGEVGQAFSFDGVDDYVSVPDSTAWDFGTNDFSIELWANFAQIKKSMIIHQQSGSGAGGFEFDYQNHSLIFARDPQHIAAAQPWSPQTNQWYHVAVTRSSGTYRLYVDAALLGTPQFDSNQVNDVTGPLRIGNWAAEPGYELNGLIDELSIYNRALSAGEIAGIAGAGIAGKCQPVSLFVGAQGGGSVSASPQQASYRYGDVVTLTATNGPYTRFVAWRDGDTNAQRMVTLGNSNSFVATFAGITPLETLGFKQWDRSYGGLYYDSYPIIRSTPEGGYVLAGSSGSDIGGNKTTSQCGYYDAWVIKLDANGEKQWEQTVGAPGESLYIVTIEPTGDGGYVVGGSSTTGVTNLMNNCGKTSPGFGGYDYWMVRLDSDGQRLWDRTFGGTGTDGLSSIRQTTDGGFILSGVSDSPPSGNKTSPNYGGRDMWFVRTDGNGNKLWEQSYGGTNDDSAHHGFALLPDGGFVALGSSLSGASGNKTSTNYGGSDFWLVRCDAGGNKLWDRSFGGTDDDDGVDLALMADGGFVLVGQSQSGATGSKASTNFYNTIDYWVIRCDANGNQLWERTFGGIGYDAAYAVHATGDGGVILSGESDSSVSGNKTTPSFGGSDAWVVRLDANGTKLWEYSVGGGDPLNPYAPGYDYFWSVAAGGGAFTFAGGSDSPPSGNKTSPKRGGEDLWVVHLTERTAPVGTPVILVDGQFASSNIFIVTNTAQIELQSTFSNAHLYYTLDGSDPNVGLLYTGPFTVAESVIVRAVAYSGNFVQSAEADPVTITLLASPSIIQQPQSQVVGAGATVLFSILAQGTAPLRFQWLSGGSPLSGQTNAVLLLNAVQLANATNYSVVISNSFGSVTSAPATLTVLTPPGIVAQPVSVTITNGGSVMFCVTNVGTPPVEYQWRKNGANLHGQTNACLTISPVQVQDGGSYSVVVANSVGATTSDEAVLTVVVPLVVPGDKFTDRVTISGTNGFAAGTNTFAHREDGEPYHANRQGSNSVWYTWHAPASGIASFRTSGSAFDTLLGVYTGTNVGSLTEVASDDDSGGFFASAVSFNATNGADYQIAIDGFAGAAGRFVLSWLLNPFVPPLPTITVQPLSQTVPLGSNVTFSVIASGLGLTYQWYFEGRLLTNETSASLTRIGVQGADVGVYTVRIASSGQTNESQGANLEIGPVAGVQSQDKFEDLFGLSPPSFAARFIHGPFAAQTEQILSVEAGPINSQIFNSTNSTTQSFETNHCGVIGGSSRWLGLLPVTNGTIVIDTFGSTFDTVLAVYRKVSAYSNEVVTCNVAAQNGHWTRVDFPASNGVFYYIAVDGVGGASGTAYLNWGLGVAPTNPPASAARQMQAWLGGSLSFTIQTNGTPAPTVQWLLNQAPLTGETNATLALANLQLSQAGLYSAVLANFVGILTNPIAFVQISNAFSTLVESHFDHDTEGWGVFGDANPPVFHSTGGSTGGYLSAVDRNTGIFWYWVASQKYLGNRSACYGGLLQFSLKQSETLGQADQPDVIMSGGGLTLVYNAPANPGTDWTAYRVQLDEFSDWHKDTLAGPRPSQAEMLQVLSSLTNLMIRGEFSTLLDTGGLDDVSLLAAASSTRAVLMLRTNSARQFVLEWPATSSGFQLQTATTLSSTSWTDSAFVPLVTNGLNSLVLTNRNLFYRLRKP